MYSIEESGKRLKGLRINAGRTQNEVAEDIGVSRETIARIEAGKRGTTVDMIDMMAEYYGVTTDYIINGKEDKKMVIDELLERLPENKRELAVRLFEGIVERLL